MTYQGPLYGKIGRHHIKLKWTSSDVEKMQEVLDKAIARIQELKLENKQLRHTLQYNPLQLNHHPNDTH